MAELLWDHPVIKYSHYNYQEEDNEESTYNSAMWWDTSSVRIVWSFCIFSYRISLGRSSNDGVL